MDSLFVRYANALLNIAKEKGKIKETKQDINSLVEFFASNEDINAYLKSYFVEEEAKYQLVDKICKDASLKELSAFIKILIKKHRFNKFKEIANEFIKEANEELGISEGFVYSTTKLTKEQISKIEDAISKKLNHKVELVNRIDDRLIGGVKVVVHDHVFDGSLKNKIETMKNNLSERRMSNEN